MHLRNETKKRRVKFMFVHNIRRNETRYDYNTHQYSSFALRIFPNKVDN